jgi:hypothetical protein
MKTYVITLAKTFPAWHPRKGEPTEFLEKFLNGQTGNGNAKLHTIRANYPLWEKRIKEVQNGNAVLSVRQWSGRPYASKQVEIATLDASDRVGIQRLEITNLWGCNRCTVLDDNLLALFDVDPAELAKNDGLSFYEWLTWFKSYDLTQPLAIIHFTKFRY